MVRSTLLQVSRGRQIASGGGPPVCVPETPLNPEISHRSSPYEEISICVLIIFDELSYGVPKVSVRQRDPLKHPHIFDKIMKNDEKLMFPESIQDHVGNA